MMRSKSKVLAMTLVAASMAAGCSSGKTMIFPNPPKNFEVMGHAEGSASGSLGVITPAYNFIPMGLNGRTQRAYDAALARIPGATSMINVTIEESWWWWVIGTGRTVTITGDAIREKGK
jgi:hypothetical protein